MNSPLSPDDSALESLLRRDRAELPDAGFTARVAAALPPARPAWERRRLVAGAAGAAAGLALTLANGSGWRSWVDAAYSLELSAGRLLAALGDPINAVILAAAFCAVLAALRPSAARGALPF